MLKVRVIAVVLIDRGNVVQTRQFKVTNIVGNVKTAVKFFAAWDADEIVLIDISPQPWDGMLKCVELVVDNVLVPVTVGGHINDPAQIRDIMSAGGDKILTRRGATPEFINAVASRHGSQVLICGVDACYPQLAAAMASFGAGEILFNSMARDGTKLGLDVDGVQAMSRVPIPVIAMGGCGEPIHALEAVKAGASAVAVGNALHYREHAVVKIKKCLAKHGVPIRDSRFAVL